MSWLVDVRTQAPLQPLQDNLESQTYETFEKDGTKYATYRAAVAAALRDRVPDAEAGTRTTVLMVRWRDAAGCFRRSRSIVQPRPFNLIVDGTYADLRQNAAAEFTVSIHARTSMQRVKGLCCSVADAA